MTSLSEVAAVRREALAYLACPECGGNLKLSSAIAREGRIQEGVLTCACKRSFPIINHVARLLPDALFNELVEKRHPQKCQELGVRRTSAALNRVDREKLATQKAFGFEWLNYPKVYAEYERQFLEWVQPVKPQFFKGKVVLDAGCGTGRHAYFAAKYGAKLVLGLDLSDAVDVAAENTKNFDNVTIVQGDIFHPPFKKKFNYIYSIGVIHHLPSPAGGFASLQRYLVPGGAFSAWLYGREGNTLLPFFDVLRKLVFRRLPLPVTRMLAWLGCVAVTAAIHAVYKPVGKVFPFTKKWLPQYDFMLYLGRLNFTVRHSIIFDQMIAPTAFYLRKDQILRWYQDASMEDVQLTWRNKNSWCAFGKTAK